MLIVLIWSIQEHPDRKPAFSSHKIWSDAIVFLYCIIVVPRLYFLNVTFSTLYVDIMDFFPLQLNQLFRWLDFAYNLLNIGHSEMRDLYMSMIRKYLYFNPDQGSSLSEDQIHISLTTDSERRDLYLSMIWKYLYFNLDEGSSLSEDLFYYRQKFSLSGQVFCLFN